MKISTEISQPWQTLETTYPFITPWFRLRQDRLRTHLGDEISYTYHEHPGCVLVVPLTHDKQLVLLKHYRYPVREWCIEVPAGRLIDESDGLDVARKELLEEAGGIGEHWQFVGKFYTSTGSSTEQAQVYLTTGVVLYPNQPESTELMHVILVEWEEALKLALEGRVSDGPSALALLFCQAHIRQYCSNLADEP